MKVWVITGDKQETAINIAYSCSLLRSGMKRLELNATTSEVHLCSGPVDLN